MEEIGRLSASFEVVDVNIILRHVFGFLTADYSQYINMHLDKWSSGEETNFIPFEHHIVLRKKTYPVKDLIERWNKLGSDHPSININYYDISEIDKVLASYQIPLTPQKLNMSLSLSQADALLKLMSINSIPLQYRQNAKRTIIKIAKRKTPTERLASLKKVVACLWSDHQNAINKRTNAS